MFSLKALDKLINDKREKFLKKKRKINCKQKTYSWNNSKPEEFIAIADTSPASVGNITETENCNFKKEKPNDKLGVSWRVCNKLSYTETEKKSIACINVPEKAYTSKIQKAPEGSIRLNQSSDKVLQKRLKEIKKKKKLREVGPQKPKSKRLNNKRKLSTQSNSDSFGIKDEVADLDGDKRANSQSALETNEYSFGNIYKSSSALNCKKNLKSKKKKVELIMSSETAKGKANMMKRDPKFLDSSSETLKDNNLDLDAELNSFYSEIGLSENIFEEIEKDVPVPDYSESSIVSVGKYANLLSKQNQSELQYTTKENKPYLCCRLYEGELLVALFPGTQILINGNYWLKLVLGSISVLGYQFSKGERQAVFSPERHTALSINVIEGVQIKTYKEDKLKENNLPLDWLQDFNIAEDHSIAIVSLGRLENNMTNLLQKGFGMFNTVYPSQSYNLDLWKEVAGIELLEHTKFPKLKVFKESSEWNDCITNIKPRLSANKNLRIVVAGGKGAGKSSLLKYFVNSFLSVPGVSEVAWLDLDPGQPEFTVPGLLSLSRISEPIFGPSFSHGKMTFNYQRKMLLGDVSVNNVIREYLNIVQTLVADYKKFKKPRVPLVVNTMGYTAGAGLDMLVDILRTVKPTHVINVMSSSENNNFQLNLASSTVSRINRGIMNIPYVELNYDLNIFRTMATSGGDKSSKILREIRVISYLSGLWAENESNMVIEKCKPVVKIDWRSIAVHVHGEFVPPTHVLQTINASLVALCQVEDSLLECWGDELPLRVQDEKMWVSSNTCLGWGIVKGIDPITREIHVLTPMDTELVNEEVNVLAMPRIFLPRRFQELCCSYTDAPYWQKCIEQP